MSTITNTPRLSQSIINSSHGARLEPSPASTYGSSITGDDDETPQTPNDKAVLLNELSMLSINRKSNTPEDFSPTFVRNGAQSDDPFLANSPQTQASAQRTPTGKLTKRDSNSDDSHLASISSQSSSAPASPRAIQTKVDAQHRRFIPDFVYETSGIRKYDDLLVTSQDAQAIYPPSSCVFVANLLQSESDESLEVAVLEVFREFGTVFVKIRRDVKHMPFAFCQYTNDESAERAIKDGRGRLINGRPCRCEKAKAHRLFFFERKYGTKITPDEVEHLLRDFGRLTECRPITHLEMATNNLGEGVVVNFDLFESGKNACQLISPCSSPSDRNQSDPTRRAYLDTYEIDRRSIFIGNLPTDIGELEVKEIFSKYGDIVNISVHKNESTIDRKHSDTFLVFSCTYDLEYIASSKHCFAFLEFTCQPSVEKAITDLNGILLRGKTLRVSQKDSETARARSRRQINRPQSSSTACTYQNPIVSPHTLCGPTPCLTPSPASQTQFGGFVYTASGYANSLCLDTSGQYWVTPTPPFNPSYPNSPPFQVSTFQNSQYQSVPFYDYSGSPHGPHSYNWHQTTAPIWNASNIPPTVPYLNPSIYSSPVVGPPSHNQHGPLQSPSGHSIVDSSKEFTK
ncbi:hypothetical protein EPUL_004372 [Erysiphe pulchra]|uniref:RRM domain-containing protein n=1 Tax=Erysiphe pulchra TaxID=225359 RepID=A0A2S4PM15_9PEZI|nr:hypothetical protein EPUL_004372 [Erysiphe pulchra]